MKKFFLAFGLVIVFVFLTLPSANAQVSNQVNVSAVVPSKVIKDKSEVYLNPTETLADPASHQLFLKVTLKDKDDNPLKNLDVWSWTNRGEVDLIEILTGLDADSQQKGPNGQGKKGKTGADGSISFSISSWTPGEAILYLKADNLIEFDSQDIKFLPLPFPAQLTLTVPIPGTGQEITLLSPQEQEKKLTPEQKEAKRLANIGTKITIPFWVFVLVILWIFLIPLFIILMALSIRKIRRTERREMMLLTAIAKAEHINQLKETIKRPL